MTTETMAGLPPSGPPLRERLGPLAWARAHLFRTWYDSLLTLTFGAAFAWVAVAAVRWLVGSDFTILRVNLTLFMVGRFPRDQLWRPWVAIFVIAVMIGLAAGAAAASARDRADQAGLPYSRTRWRTVARRFAPMAILAALVLALTQTITPTLLTLAALATGVAATAVGWRLPATVRRWSWLISLVLLAAAYLALSFGETGVPYTGWGGLMINVFLTVAGIVLAFPLGLLLALGRRSSLPVVRTISVGYIEFIRGVPLITLLLMGIFAIGFFLPESIKPADTTRALIAIVMFEAAYIAEVVRGGLQSVPKGQVEASQALGMRPWKTMRLIVLPQALRATIPAMVGQFISLFKDTTLVSIVGILDLLAVAQAVTSQPQFLAQGLAAVTLPFAALIFWVGSYTMSREARRLEKKLGVGER